jgi:hypothetical protein
VFYKHCRRCNTELRHEFTKRDGLCGELTKCHGAWWAWTKKQPGLAEKLSDVFSFQPDREVAIDMWLEAGAP